MWYYIEALSVGIQRQKISFLLYCVHFGAFSKSRELRSCFVGALFKPV